MEKEKTRILFICLGNIIRSALSEGIFDKLLKRKNYRQNFQAESRGTGAWHIGQPADTRTIAVAARHGVDIRSHRAKQLSRQDLLDFDLFIVMDRDNYHNVLQLAESVRDLDLDDFKKRVFFLREFDPDTAKGELASVPDPYYNREGDGFEEVFQIVDRSIKGFSNYLEKKIIK